MSSSAAGGEGDANRPASATPQSESGSVAAGSGSVQVRSFLRMLLEIKVI